MRKLCLVLLSMAALLGCKHTAEESQTKIEEPLLLLDEGPASADDADMVDNQRCHVCHGNFMFEDFSVTHAKGDVGCETCHGSSDAHCDDEDHVIPPDRFFAKTEINALCLECHDREALDTKRKHRRLFAGKAPEGKQYCTSCHGEHRMNLRSRRWNPETREVIVITENEDM